MLFDRFGEFETVKNSVGKSVRGGEREKGEREKKKMQLTTEGEKKGEKERVERERL